MRIIFFSHDANVYGASRSLLDLVEGFKSKGALVKVTVPKEGPLTELLKAKSIPYFIVEQRWWKLKRPSNLIRELIHFTKFYKSLSKYKEIVSDFNPDVIYSNSSVIYSGLLLASKFNIKHVWHIREFGELDHGLRITLPDFIIRRLMARSDLFIFISNALMGHYKLKHVRQSVIYNGPISRKDFEHNKRIWNEAERNGFTFTIIGTISIGKNQIQGIEAFSRLKDINNLKLKIVGQGNQDKLKEFVSILNLEDKVEFVGHVNDIRPIYLDTDCLLVCSKFEGFGRVTVEAMSYSIPVIGFDNGGTSEIIRDGETGYLYRTTLEFEQKLRKVLFDHEMTNKIRMNGWNEAGERFSREKYVDNCYKQVKSIL